MQATAPLKRLARLKRGDRLLLAEALAALAFASFAVKLMPFRRVAALASRGAAAGAKGDTDPDLVARKVRWAVNAWGRRVPWRAVCFQRGLAAQLMLRRRGLPAVLHYGAAQSSEAGVSAHVWVTLAGAEVIGGEEAPRFARLASFPPGQ
jgi:hypothetical protein